MIYYKLEIVMEKQVKEEAHENEDYSVEGRKVNRTFEQMKYKDFPMSVHVTDMDAENMRIVWSMCSEDVMGKNCEEIKTKVEAALSTPVTVKSNKEITVEEFRRSISDACSNGYIKNSRIVVSDLKIDFEDNRYFHVKEGIVSQKKLSKKAALEKAGKIMGNEEYIKEIERIYSRQNTKEFYCHPVHYHISAGNEESAKAMTRLLLEALLNNGRLLGHRISYVSEIKENCYDEDDFEHLICNSQGATVILSMNTSQKRVTEITDEYDDVIAYFGKLTNKYQKNVLFIFQEVTEQESIGKKMLAGLDESMRLIHLEEGVGQKEQAKEFLKSIIQNSEYAKFWEEETEEILPEQESYNLSEIYGFYDKWVQKIIYEKAYRAYGLKKKVVVEKKTVGCSAYEELQQMVGLGQIKEMVDRIIAMNKIQKKRSEMGLSTQNGALHMIFTGNPGSAKTTVARLLTRILFEEGIIKNKKIVECGRGDLVGRYVGWTAKQVKSKFREATDGVLFVDEAYSLVDDRDGSFGDEAINTIVQEMENHREDVIVIFAGYPDKMKTFLQKNEGLRSRIAFHLDFPNYGKNELLEILSLMVKQKGYHCEASAFDKCASLFEQAACNKDFGNGRYVRNLLEQAIMRQSNRLMTECVGMELDKEQMNCLVEADFEGVHQTTDTSVMPIGFQCA